MSGIFLIEIDGQCMEVMMTLCCGELITADIEYSRPDLGLEDSLKWTRTRVLEYFFQPYP